MFHLPSEVLEKIYQYDNTYRVIYSKCIYKISKKYVKEFIKRDKYHYCFACDKSFINIYHHRKSKKHKIQQLKSYVKIIEEDDSNDIYRFLSYF